MQVETNLDDILFSCECSHWLDDSADRIVCAKECVVGWDWHCGVGDLGTLRMEKLLAEPQTRNGLVISGVVCASTNLGRQFKNICIVIVPMQDAFARKEWLGGFVEVRGGEIIEFDDSPVYDEKAALKVLEDFGYGFCDMVRYWEWYNDQTADESPRPTFIDWFKDAQLIDEDQLPEAEFEGPQWTYYYLLDWQDMVDAFYAGAERWRRERLKIFDFDVFLSSKMVCDQHGKVPQI